jgi:hypothetical protein
MMHGHSQAELLAQIESRYEELLEGLCELEDRVSTTLEVINRRRPPSGGCPESSQGYDPPDVRACSAENGTLRAEPLPIFRE